jgi:predicted nucleic acid-binding protein
MNEPKAFLDTSVLFAAVLSESGGARLILKLGEAETIRLWVGPRVLQEAEAVLKRKLPERKALFALLLDRARVAVGPSPDEAALVRAREVVSYAPDAHVLAEALACGANFFVSLDREHLVGNPRAASLPFPIGTPGDFLAWLRDHLASQPVRA